MATPFADAVTLTPVRIKKIRPSLSPLKSPKEVQPKTRALSEVLEKKPSMPANAEYDHSTAALNFREFSFWSEDKVYKTTNLSNEHLDALANYLTEHYGAVAIEISLPFLIIECAPNLPPESERPFSVAGAISIWAKPGDFKLSFSLIGERGRGPRLALSEKLATDLQQMESPDPETLLALARAHFEDAIAISYLWDRVLVELPTQSNKEFLDSLDNLPDAFTNAAVNLDFHNGPLPFTERKRLVKPDAADAADLEGPSTVADTSDYVKHCGAFYPGSMIRAVDGDGQDLGSVSAGILVEKGYMRRLTVSYHCWEPLVTKNPEKFGSADIEFCKILQGEPGTNVGFVHERIRNTDIALAKLLPSVQFQNAFMEIEAQVKRLLPSSEISIGDEFLIDSFVTGKQRLRCLGSRFRLARKANARSQPTLKGPEDLLPPDDNIYISLRQGIYASNKDNIPGHPKIRAAVCGAALLRCSQYSNRQRDLDSVLKDGEVAGIMHFADLQSKGQLDTFLCYADSFDDLAAEGWKVVQTKEKRDLPSDEDEDADLDKSPEKRSKQ